jgi:hypothetical protein
MTASQWPQWDAFVENHPSGTICHTSAWCRAIEETFPHIQNRFVALEETHSNQIIAALPTYLLRSWLTGNRLVCAPFASWCDPLVQNPHELQALLHCAAQSVSPSQPPPAELRCRLTSAITEGIGLHPATTCLHHTIPLTNRSHDEIWQAVSRTGIRRRIKQAQQSGIQIQQADSPEQITLFHAMLTSTRHRMGLPRIPLKFFTALHHHLGPSRLAVLIARSNNHPVASVLTTWNQQTFNLDYLGETSPSIPPGTSQLLYWKALELAIQQNCREFSFGRTDPSQTGLAEYKLRWGATEETLKDFHNKPNRPIAPQPQGSGKNLARSILRQLPSPLYNLAGNLFYRHR